MLSGFPGNERQPRHLCLTACLFFFLAIADSASAAVLSGTPASYRQILTGLEAGDELQLSPGIYTEGLPIHNLAGSEKAPIVITGPVDGPAAVFTGSDTANTVSIRHSSYVVLKNLELDGAGKTGDAVKADDGPPCPHHITIENLHIHNYDHDQQTVGISTVGCATWGWVIRGNLIERAGTGMYLGDSYGNNPFIDGLIEYNVIKDSIGYNLQIKHQNPRPVFPGMPQRVARTVLRYNVFGKEDQASGAGDARPNVLVGHWPLTGTGSEDLYEVYGNFFYQNKVGQPLFQGEGNIALYNNLFVNDFGDAIDIHPHNDVPRRILVFNNTVVARGLGIRVSGGHPGYTQTVIGNAVFANKAVVARSVSGNIIDSYDSATRYLENPTGRLGELDLHPRPGKLTRTPVDLSSLKYFQAWDLDFNAGRRDPRARGAFSEGAKASDWRPGYQRIKTSRPDSQTLAH